MTLKKHLKKTFVFFTTIIYSMYVYAAPPGGVNINLFFSTLASEKMKSSGENVILSVSVYGVPYDKNYANELGVMDISSTTIEKPGHAGVIYIDGLDIPSKTVSQVIAPEVNINIFSARNIFPDNILDCESVNDGLDKLLKKNTITIKCRLIDEE